MALAQEWTWCPAPPVWPTLSQGRGLPEGSKAFMQEWKPLTASTPCTGAAPAPFSHTLHSLGEPPRQTVQNMEKCLKSYFRISEYLSVFLDAYQSPWSSHEPETHCSNFCTLLLQLVPNKLQTSWQRQTRLHSTWGIISTEEQQAGVFSAWVHSAKAISAGGGSTVHSHSSLITELGSDTSSTSSLIFLPVPALVGTEHQTKAGTWVKPPLAGISNPWLHQFPDEGTQTQLQLNGRGQEPAVRTASSNQPKCSCCWKYWQALLLRLHID